MSMSRKDFVSLAADIKWQIDGLDSSNDADAKMIKELERFVRFAILPTLKASNSLFDTQRFLTACGF